MANPRPATLPQWLALLTMASTVTAGIMLDDIQPITSLSISRNCLLTYRIPLQGCDADDFKGNKCSRSCAQGVLRIEDLLQLSCPDDTAPADSLLAMALGDQLLDYLCPDEPQTVESISFTTSEAEGTTLTLTSVQPERTTTSKAWATVSATMGTSSTKGQSVEASTASEGPMPTEGGKGPTAPEPTVTSEIESVSTTNMPIPTITESSLSVSSDAVADTTTTTTPTILTNRPIKGGGGSPFDLPAGIRSGQQKLAMSGLGAAFGTIFLGGLYLWL